jgi:glycosyltransferase involved in cell wall biosynthesis
MRLPLTAIILTHNEAGNMSRCLAALHCVDDVVLLDSGSSDNTVALAQELRPDIRVFEHPFEDFGAQRNWALDHAAPRYPWVLFVDADEYCEPELLSEIHDFIAAPGSVVGAFIAGKNYFLGTWLRRTTFYPSYQLRLLKMGQVRYRKEGHGQREVTDGELCYLRNGWRHEGFSKGVHQWVARHNQYSTDEVDLILRLRHEPVEWRALVGADPILRRRALKVLAARVPARPFWRFLYTYVIRRGFLDGRAGLDYCLLRVAHDLHIGVKIRERRALSGSDSR